MCNRCFCIDKGSLLSAHLGYESKQMESIDLENEISKEKQNMAKMTIQIGWSSLPIEIKNTLFV